MKWSCVWCTAYRRLHIVDGVLQMPLAVLPDELCQQCRWDAIEHFGAGDWLGWSSPKARRVQARRMSGGVHAA